MGALLVASCVTKVAVATPFIVYNTTPTGTATVTVAFNDSATLRLVGSSTNMASAGSQIDNVSGCDALGGGAYECNYTGHQGVLAMPWGSSLGTLADEIHYDDGASLPTGKIWHRFSASDGQVFVVAIGIHDTDDFADDVFTPLSSYDWPCLVHRDGQGKIDTCGNSGSDCTCMTVTPGGPSKLDRILVWIGSWF